MTNDAAPDLADICADLSAELDEVTSSAEGDGLAYARAASVFARVSGSALAVRMPADIAAAALRTPDTSLDPDEPGWVRFAPRPGAEHVSDRATAWFQTAWRHAADG